MSNKGNPVHQDLFTIPEPTYSTEVAVTKPLPPQRVITGHKQTDAYLWGVEVIHPQLYSGIVAKVQSMLEVE